MSTAFNQLAYITEAQCFCFYPSWEMTNHLTISVHFDFKMNMSNVHTAYGMNILRTSVEPSFLSRTNLLFPGSILHPISPLNQIITNPRYIYMYIP